MGRIVVLGLLALGILVLPAGCIVSVGIAGAAVTATSLVTPCPSPASPATTACPGPGVGVTSVVDPGLIPAPDVQASVAVAAALTAVGRGGRYVAEGNGPVDFDCSGLTSYAWRQAGVSLVDYSYTQRTQTRDIPRSMVQPGDLVFWFGGSEHHVAIVTTVDGSQITIAEAANPDAGIRTRLLGGSWDEAYLTGFGRVTRS
ncbi:MAG: NlpC/P60 family protein [Actinomycetota bacterium]|nr:NlpC/P60 family protein [Actinomycetota bacterium]